MNKRYKYNGKIYCDDNLSEEIENYGGDLYDLFFSLRNNGEASEVTYYYSPYNPENYYDSIEELMENEYEEFEVNEDE